MSDVPENIQEEQHVVDDVKQQIPQPRQPTNLKGVLRFAMEAANTSGIPDTSSESCKALAPLDEDRINFLQKALQPIQNQTHDDTMYACIHKLQEIDKLQLDDAIEEFEVALNNIIEQVYDIDSANVFQQIGGFKVFPPCLECTKPQIRTLSCELLAELCQNNPQCQAEALASGLIEKLLDMIKNGHTNVTDICANALYALSAIVRGNSDAAKVFVKHDGINVLLDAAATLNNNNKVRRKSCFLLTNLIDDANIRENIRDQLIQLNAIQRLIAVIATHPMSSHEDVLGLLRKIVSNNNPRALDICRNEKNEVKDILLKHLKYTDISNEERLSCQLLLKEVFDIHI